jgi:transcriptional regulator with XRE-family HTH domain
MMLEWNYYDTQRTIANEISTRPMAVAAAAGPPVEAALRALQGTPEAGGARPASTPDNLGSRLRQVRESTGQSAEIIALLLGLNVAQYHRLEAGEAPGDELLRRISMVYDWNYHDLQALLRSQQARALQPRRLGSPYPGASASGQRLKALLQEVEGLFATLPDPEQQFVLTQLELVRETLRKLRAAS